MAEPRFLVEGPMPGPGDYELGRQESQHAAQALRLRAGDWVVVFDGLGRRADAEILESGKERVRVRVDAVETEERLPLALTIATAIPKGKRWQLLVEKCTELGVDRIVPMLTERSVVKGEGSPEKWRRWMVEAAKQSRRAWVPEIGEPIPLSGVLALVRGERALLFKADPAGAHPREYQDLLKNAARVVVMVGPEGGFTDREKEECRAAGGRALRLSPFVLRIETAAATVCAIIREMLL